MCGIAGIYDLSRTLAVDYLEHHTEAMADSLRHRGPDDDGVWIDADSGIGLGHRRLAVIAPTPEGRQPATSACARYVLVFNGEIYNFRDIARQLSAEGHNINSASDTVVLLAAIAKWGVEKTVKTAIGMFAFAVFDRESRNLTLVRDRLGIKPLYWGNQGERYVFGSEIKALHASGLIEPTRDPDALAAFLRFAYIPAPSTIFREIKKLAPGTIMTIAANGKNRDQNLLVRQPGRTIRTGRAALTRRPGCPKRIREPPAASGNGSHDFGRPAGGLVVRRNRLCNRRIPYAACKHPESAHLLHGLSRLWV